MPEELDVGSPEWWLDRLAKRLDERASAIRVYDDYYSGRHPLAFASEKFRKAFGGLFDQFADNWCQLVVDAVEERLNVEGFRVSTGDPGGGAADPLAGDQEAWAIWQRNNLDSDSEVAHTEALIHGYGYALVWPGDDGKAQITIEHPTEAIVATSVENRRRRTAALKKFTGDDGEELATLYLPDGIYKWRRKKADGSGAPQRWERREIDSEAWPVPNPYEVVPVVELANRPRLLAGGSSELHAVIPQQDAVNKLVADMLVASEFGAFKQRWATGLEVPRDPETDQPIEPFKAAIERLWISESSETTFGEFGETNLGNFVVAIENRVQAIASQTRTPPHYFYLRGEFPSGESIKSAETGLVAKVRRRMRHFGETWEEVLRLAFLVEGDSTRASATAMETIWADPESRTEGEHIDAVLKKQALGVPQEQLWEDAGYTPQQIARFKALQREAALEGDAIAIEALGKFNADAGPTAPPVRAVG